MTWLRYLHIQRQIALVYFVIIGFATTLNYIPGMRDDHGLVWGIFALDPFDDLLHVASAIWALTAALMSVRASRLFLIIFGAAYLGDGAIGYLTAYGYLDFGILRHSLEGLDFGLTRFLANLPHIALGGFALWAGFYLRRGAP